MPKTAGSETKKGRGTSGKPKKKAPKKPPLTAVTADKHELYEAAVQNVEAEIDFVDATFRKIRGRKAETLREDFCGTANTSCEWVRRRRSNRAVGLDIDGPTLDWGLRNKVAELKPEQRERVRLLQRDVLDPGDAVGVDCVLAMNFSYWLFHERASLLRYFRSVRESLGNDGIFFQDFYGGSDAMKETEERRKCKLPGKGAYTYVWDQHEYDPISGRVDCRIHFEFKDGTKKRNAFKYDWRLWTLPELRELLAEAGFGSTTIYWEGDELDDDGEPTGEGNGVFKPAKRGHADDAFICYIVSER